MFEANRAVRYKSESLCCDMCLSACLPSSLVDCAETDHVRENENGREKGQASENVSVTLQVKETMAGNAEQIHCKLACLLQAGLFVVWHKV